MCTTPHAHATCLCKLCLYHADADQMAVMLRYRLIWEVSCPNDQALGRVTRTPLRPAACVRSVQCVRLTIRVKRFFQVAKATQGIMYLRGTKASNLAAREHERQPLQGMSNDLPRRYSGCMDCSARNLTLPTTSCVSRRLQLYGVCLSMGTPSINTCDTARMQIQSHLKSANIISKN